ncbi:hypothetical protein [Clostridium rectalis]|uniref:hypothetical protein n=1 Tax=Clostridium rectalis TaxID=2040295 RepID=UPI000F633A80|nr:hypothetical protein [Clostridium rectalis]
MSLNKVAKEMTREEFLNSKYVKEVDEEGDITYKCIEDYIFSIDDCCSNCNGCWENAIKDIKFKGEDNMKFDWEGFKNNDFVVLCDTEEKAKDFLKQCDKRALSWCGGESAENYIYYKGCDTCYSYNFNNHEHLQYSSKSFYLDNGCKVVEWGTENKIDYDREYNIMEIMEFPEETIFNTEGYDFKVTNGELRLKDNTGVWILEHLRKGIITSKFKLAKKDKKVSFKEAIQSYGNHIYCIWEDCNGLKKRTYYFIKNKYVQIEGDFIHSMCPEQILNGEWYIKQN